MTARVGSEILRARSELKNKTLDAHIHFLVLSQSSLSKISLEEFY